LLTGRGAAHPDFAAAGLSRLRQVIGGGAPVPRPSSARGWPAAAPSCGGIRPHRGGGGRGARLAAYKVPAHFRAVPGLPKLTSGKLDRVTLGSVPADLAHGGGDAG